MTAAALLKGLNDPSTRTGTAFYAALAAVLWDVARHGLSMPAGVVLLALAGLQAGASILGALGGPGSPSGPSPLPVPA